MKIAFLTDTHTNRAVEGDTALYRGRFDRVIAAVRAEKVGLVLHGGDLTDNGSNDEIDDFRAQARTLGRMLCVPGNHDVGSKRHSEQKDPVTAERVAAYEQRHGRSFWARRVGELRIVGINAPVLGSGLDAEAAQWRFLERELSRRDAPPTLLLTHYPLFLERPDEADDPYWNVAPEPRRRLLTLLAQPQVRLKGILSGHLHRPIAPRWGEIPTWTSPPVAFGLPWGKQAEGWTLVNVAADGSWAAQFRSIGKEA